MHKVVVTIFWGLTLLTSLVSLIGIWMVTVYDHTLTAAEKMPGTVTVMAACVILAIISTALEKLSK
jgi:heme A synthase